MDRRRNHTTASSVVIYGLYLIIQHFVLVCLLLLAGSQAQETTTRLSPSPTTPVMTTTPTPPQLDYPVSFEQLRENPRAHMRFCDTETPIYDDDPFCNRIVAIVSHPDSEDFGTGQIVVPGIFIDDRRVLTSYTPFRILRHEVERSQIFINYLVAKALYAKSILLGYFFGRIQLSCARQIVAMKHDVIVDEQWHGSERTHTPMHDLMILQVEKSMEFIESSSWHKTTIGERNIDVEHIGPNITAIAEVDDDFPERYKIVSLGLMDHDHVFNKNHLHTSKEYERDDRLKEDCEEWFPRDWGFFFCIKNEDEFVGIGSGALLVGIDEDGEKGAGKVFGIGSFMLKKNKASILVFTDIRPYLDALNMTCNAFDEHE